MSGMEAESIHTCVTSPPYWGLRDYGVDGQMGLETTPEAYVVKMVEVFREVRRVLRDDGTLWLNLGDSYQNAKGQAGGVDPKQPARRHGLRPQDVSIPGLKPKDLVGIPWRVAFALQADGWYLRQDIIWHKPNPMPESVTDRCTKAHEYLFLLSKSARYYWDAEAVKEKGTGRRCSTFRRGVYVNNETFDNSGSLAGSQGEYIDEGGRNRRSVWTMDLEEWTALWYEAQALGDVWKITTKPYKGAHFATFPPDLIEPCILAGTSEEGCCPECGTPWVRVIEKERVPTRPGTDSKVNRASDKENSPYHEHSGMVVGNRDPRRHCTATKTTGWKRGCKCGVEHGEPEYSPVPCTVFDPFLGSGTTAAVARKNGCQCVGIELSEDYLKLAANRLQQRVLF
jgi:DNA modification methylase